MKVVKYVNLGVQFESGLREEVTLKLIKIIQSGDFILGNDLLNFEKNFADYCGTKYAIGVANGTDALFLVMKALGIGPFDEVITAPNSFLASAATIVACGANPVFVDVADDYNIDPDLIEKAVNDKTKAIMPVHLTGRPADMKRILDIAKKHQLYVIEDAAQAVGALYNGAKTGSLGIAGCFSFHPLKTLNAYGDGGAITTNDEKLYETILKSRNHGLKNRDECEFFAYNSRLDNLQAAVLDIKLRKLDSWTARIREIALAYQERLGSFVKVPVDKAFETAAYHTFVIQTEQRDELQAYLLENGIETKIHYPIPIHLQEAARYLGYKPGDFANAESQAKKILSLPIYPELTDKEVSIVCDKTRAFFER